MSNEVNPTTTLNALGYLGALHLFGRRSNTVLKMIGGLSQTESGAPLVQIGTGFRRVTQREFPTNVDWDLPAPSQPARKEAESAPAARTYKPSQTRNVIQIYEETVSVSFLAASEMTRLTSDGVLNAFGSDAFNDFGNFPRQLNAALGKIAQDFNYTCVNGSFANPADPTSTALQSRGLRGAITTNVMDAEDAELSDDLLMNLYRFAIDESGMQPDNLTIVANTGLYGDISRIYRDQFSTSDRFIGGLQVRQIYTAYGILNLAQYEMDMPQNELLFVNPNVIRGTYLPVPNPDGGERPALFLEDLAHTKSADEKRVYGQLGFDHGPEWAHAKLTNLKVRGSGSGSG